MTLVAMLEGIDLAVLSFGGRAGREGRESFLTGKTSGMSSVVSRGGGAGRAFEKRERPPDRGGTSEDSMLFFYYAVCVHGYG